MRALLSAPIVHGCSRAFAGDGVGRWRNDGRLPRDFDAAVRFVTQYPFGECDGLRIWAPVHELRFL